MALGKFRPVVISLVLSVAASVVSIPASAGDAGKLEAGVWIAKVVETQGLGPAQSQWSYVVAPDPSGRHAAAYGTVDVGLYNEVLDAMTDRVSPLLIDVVMTGPRTAQFNSVWYGLKNLTDPVYTNAEIVYIGVNRGVIDFVSAGKAEGTHNISYYWASQDGDNDGLPDPGEEPFAEAVVHTLETRLGQ